MKPQNIAVAAIAVFIAIGLAWWIVLPAASPSKPAELAPLSPTTPAAGSLQIKSPSANPASSPGTASSASTRPIAPSAISPSNDPRRALSTTIGDMVARLDKGDLVGYLTLYAPPEQLQNLLKVNNVTIDQFVQNAVTQPGFLDQMQHARDTLHSIQNAQPDLNAAGDMASYVISPPPATGPKVLVFRKINDLWYVQN